MTGRRLQVETELPVIEEQLRSEQLSQGVRLHAVWMVAKGADIRDVEEVHSYTTGEEICSWVQRYGAEGIEGLKDPPRSSPQEEECATMPHVNEDPSPIEVQLRQRYAQAVRLLAVYQIAKGKLFTDLQGLYYCNHRTTISRWVHQYDTKGIDGLKKHFFSSCRPFLDSSCRAELKEVLCHSPRKYGYKKSWWTNMILIHYIKEHYGVVYRGSNIYTIMRSLGYSKRKHTPAVKQNKLDLDFKK